MSVSGSQPPRQTAGAVFDAWYPRVMKVVGLIGVVTSLILWPFDLFNPVVFGACFTLASGGFVGDALAALKPGKEP